MKVRTINIVAFVLLVMTSSLLTQDHLTRRYAESDRYALPSYMGTDTLFSVLGKLDWGYCYTVAQYDKYIYFGNGSLIQIIDASTPNDSIVAEYDCEGIAQDMVVIGKMLFLANTKGLEIIDLADPLLPVKRSMTKITGAMKIAGMDTLVFVASYSGTISVVSTVTPNYPVIRSTFYGGGERIRSMVYAKNKVFIGNAENADIAIVNVSNPSVPQGKYFDIGGRGFSMALVDTMLYVTTSQSFKIYGVGSSNDPVLMGSVNGFTRGKITTIIKDSSFVHVATSDSGLYTFDVSNALLPVLTSKNTQFSHFGNDPTGISIAQHKIYYAGYSALAIFNKAVALPLMLKSQKPAGGYAYKIHVQNSIAYIASSFVGLWIIDISNPNHIKPLSNLQFGGNSSDIAVSDSIIYILNRPSTGEIKPSDGIFVVNSTNLLKPKLLSRYVGIIKYTGDFLGSTFLINNKRLIVGNGTNDVSDTCVEILGITDPSNLKRMNIIKSKLDPTSMAVDDSIVFIGTSSSGLKIFVCTDSVISNWSGSHFVGDFINSILIKDKYLYLDHGTSFRIVKYTDPVTLLETGSFNRSGMGFGNWSTMYMLKNNILWSSGFYFGVIDVANVTSPYEKKRVDYTFLNYDFKVQDNIAYIGMEGGPIYSLNAKDNLLWHDKKVKSTEPEAPILYQNYPNPFNPSTTIRYQLPEAGTVRIAIYNMLGQQVRTLVSSGQAPGYYTLQWNGADDNGRILSSGMYVYRMEAVTASKQKFVNTKKMIFVK